MTRWLTTLYTEVSPGNKSKQNCERRQKANNCFNNILTHPARKQLLKLLCDIASRIEKVIDNLAGTPRPHGIEAIKGMSDTYRLRVADYRIVYSVLDDALLILIIRVAHRREVYRKF